MARGSQYSEECARRAHGEVRKSGRQERQECATPRKARHASFRQEREGRGRDEPQASHSDWPLRGSKEGCEGPQKEIELKNGRYLPRGHLNEMRTSTAVFHSAGYSAAFAGDVQRLHGTCFRSGLRPGLPR